MKRLLLYTLFFTGLLLFVSATTTVEDKKQQPTRVKIIQADELRFERRFGQDIRRLLGNVILEHDKVLMYCDSAHMLEGQNKFEAYSRVRINSGDTLFFMAIT